MAELVLINRYLEELQRELRWVRRSDRFIEEVTDHLLESLERRIGQGLDPIEAERQTLDEFGDSRLVGRTFASSLSGGIAVPTVFTRRAGYAMLVSSVLWLIGIVFQYWSDRVDQTEPWEGTPQTLYALGAYAWMAATLLLILGIAGILRRHGRATGTSGRVAFWASFPLAVLMAAPWAPGVWTTGLLIVAGSLYVSTRRHGLIPSGAVTAMVVGSLIGFVGGWWMVVTETEWFRGVAGNLPAAGVVLMAAGVAVTGRWLAGEEAVEEDDPLAVA